MLKGIFKKKKNREIRFLSNYYKQAIFLLAGTQADSPIKFSQLSKANDLAAAGDIFELGLSQALGTSKKESAADFR